ncbi:sodium:solute symporter family transporter [Marinagarivorans algicola]|uniref:sodium:solute symporter family transporter n=1 Tax=Marinagarivorans algicola TaxID=1513270 RepID=UPI0006B5B704|nr:hypothetical protein [Marinagarivorans algicola]
MTFFDIVLALIYILFSVGWGLWRSLAGARVASAHGVKAFWLAQKNFSALPVALTLMATLISSNTLVSHPGIASSSGLILLPGFFLLPFVLLFAAKKLVPFYRKHVRLSVYEYLALRFGSLTQAYASTGFVVDRLFDMAVTLVTCGIFVQVLVGMPLWLAMIAILGLTIMYVLIGGIAAVVWNDALQSVVLILGGVVVVSIISFAPFNAWLIAWEGGRFSLGDWSVSGSMLSPSASSSPWLIMLAMSIIWARKFWCDQTMVQRYLIASSHAEAAQGLHLAALMIVLILFVFNVVGAGLWGFYQGAGSYSVSDVHPFYSTVIPSVRDQIMPHFVLHYFPLGAKGIMLAAVVAAAMSSLSSDVNGVASVLYHNWVSCQNSMQTPSYSTRSQSSLRREWISRLLILLAGLCVLVIALHLVPDSTSGPLAMRVIAIASALSGAVLGVFCLAYFTIRATKHGALLGLVAGSLMGLWAVLTAGESAPWADVSWRFPLNVLLSGVLAQWVVIAVGYFVSVSFTWAKASSAQLQAVRVYTIWAKNN